MPIPIKVSELNVLPEVTWDDYFVLNDSASVTTRRATIQSFLDMIAISGSVPSASYALSASWADNAGHADSADSAPAADWAQFCLSASYASRSTWATYVYPSEPLPENTLNMVGTASWALSSSFSVSASRAVTSSNSQTASYLLHDPDWHNTGTLNGSASYALSASWADQARTVLDGSGLTGTDIPKRLVLWADTGASVNLTSSYIWTNGNFTVFNNLDNEALQKDDGLLAGSLYDRISATRGWFFLGGDVLLSGSSTTSGRGESSKLQLIVDGTATTNNACIYLSSSFVGIEPDSDSTGNMVFQTGNGHVSPFIFKSYYEFGLTKEKYDHVIIRPDGTDTYVDISGSLWAHSNVAVGGLGSNRAGALLHISSSKAEGFWGPNYPLLVTEATYYNPTSGDRGNRIGLFVQGNGRVGIGTTAPTYPLHVNGTAFVNGAVSATTYYAHHKAQAGWDTDKWYAGIDADVLAFDLSDIHGVNKRIMLSFKNGLLVQAATAFGATPVSRLEIIGSGIGIQLIPGLNPNQPPLSVGGPTVTSVDALPTGEGSGCPAVWQEIETQECGYIPAGEVVKGMHLRGINGWNEVLEAKDAESDIWRVTILDETFDVDSSHLWMTDKNVWKRVTDLKAGELLWSNDKSFILIDDVKFLRKDKYRHLKVENNLFLMGSKNLVGHNATVYFSVVKFGSSTPSDV